MDGERAVDSMFVRNDDVSCWQCVQFENPRALIRWIVIIGRSARQLTNNDRAKPTSRLVGASAKVCAVYDRGPLVCSRAAVNEGPSIPSLG